MPSLAAKLSSFSKSVKKTFKKVTTKLSLKKNKIQVVSTTTGISHEIAIVEPVVVLLPIEPQTQSKVEKFDGRFLLTSALFDLDLDDLDGSDSDDDEEDIDLCFSRDFNAEKMFKTSQLPPSVVVVEKPLPERFEYKLIRSSPSIHPSHRRRLASPPPLSPLHQVTFPPPVRPARPLTPPIGSTTATTTPPLSPASSISSIKSSLAPSTPRGRSPTRNENVVEKRNNNRFAVYEPIKIRSDGFF